MLPSLTNSICACSLHIRICNYRHSHIIKASICNYGHVPSPHKQHSRMLSSYQNVLLLLWSVQTCCNICQHNQTAYPPPLHQNLTQNTCVRRIPNYVLYTLPTPSTRLTCACSLLIKPHICCYGHCIPPPPLTKTLHITPA